MPIRIRVACIGHDFAFLNAAPSDRMNASLVSVAPEMMSTLALCALITSSWSSGKACRLMKTDVRRSEGYWRTLMPTS
jgi:hypothetical protein